MDDEVVIPGTSDGVLRREDLSRLATPEIAALKDRARLHEMMIEADSAAYLDGRGPDALAWHRIWLWCSMELDRRTTEATLEAGSRVMEHINAARD